MPDFRRLQNGCSDVAVVMEDVREEDDVEPGLHHREAGSDHDQVAHQSNVEKAVGAATVMRTLLKISDRYPTSPKSRITGMMQATPSFKMQYSTNKKILPSDITRMLRD